MNADGSEKERLLAYGYSYPDLSWSPDGTSLAGDLYGVTVINARTGARTILTNDSEQVNDVIWSPSGRYLLYAFSEDGVQGFRTIEPDGSNKQTVYTAPAGTSVSAPDFSPDGRSVSFIHRTDQPDVGHLNVLDLVTGETHVVSTEGAVPHETNWSPDGEWIAFTTTEPRLFVIRPDGTDGRRFAQLVEYFYRFEWAPDSLEIAFEANDSGSHGIYLGSPVTGIADLLVAGGRSPTWSPDGSRIAYSARTAPGEDPDLYSIDRNGEHISPLSVEDLKEDTSPLWSPNGSRIAFVRTDVPIYCSGGFWPVEAGIIGTPGNDNLVGTPEAEVIAGRGGNDEIDGLGGNDIICGGPGDDRIVGGEGNDDLQGDAGTDLLEGDAGNDLLEGGDGDDFSSGASGRDALVYGVYSDAVTVDLLLGESTGAGHDLFEGIEDVYGSGEADTIIGDHSGNGLFGGTHMGDGGDDVIRGRGGRDRIEGNGGSDRLFGGRGRDMLHGDTVSYNSSGRDILNGGLGRDLCTRGERYLSCERRP